MQPESGQHSRNLAHQRIPEFAFSTSVSSRHHQQALAKHSLDQLVSHNAQGEKGGTRSSAQQENDSDKCEGEWCTPHRSQKLLCVALQCHFAWPLGSLACAGSLGTMRSMKCSSKPALDPLLAAPCGLAAPLSHLLQQQEGDKSSTKSQKQEVDCFSKHVSAPMLVLFLCMHPGCFSESWLHTFL